MSPVHPLLTLLLAAATLDAQEIPVLPGPTTDGQQEQTSWGPWPTQGWVRATPQSQGMDPHGIREAFQYAIQRETDALVVIRNGYLVAEWYSAAHDQSSRLNSYSMAKSVTSALVGIAIEEGLIGAVNDTASQHIPEWRNPRHGPITVRNLLSMNSGLRQNPSIDSGLFAAPDQNVYTVGVAPGQAPDDVWKYQQCGVQALSMVLLDATGMQPVDYAREKIWGPLGFADEATWAEDPAGNTTTYTSAYCTAREWAKFGYLYLCNGEWDGVQIVPERWVRESTRPAQYDFPNYGYLWWLNVDQEWDRVPADHFRADGLEEQNVYVVPSLNLVVVRTGETVTYPWKDNVFLGTICEAVQ